MALSISFSWILIYIAVFIFTWMPLHFWAFTILHSEDYISADIPMLPTVLNNRKKTLLLVSNTALIILLSLFPLFYGGENLRLVYLIDAILLDLVLKSLTIRAVVASFPAERMKTFLNASIAYFILMLFILDLTRL